MSKERKKCPLCKSKKFYLVYPATTDNSFINNSDLMITQTSLGHGPIVRCLRCDLLFVNPRIEKKKMLKIYARVKDPSYLDEMEGRTDELNLELKRIQKYIKKGALLDLGCFAGYFLLVAKRQGWQTWGVDPSKWAIEYAKKELGLKNVYQGTIVHRALKKRKFDLITMWDVIEHLDDPLKTLNIVCERLKPSGYLALSTPNFSNIFYKILKERYWFIEKKHLFFFTPKTIKRLLEKAGFRIIKIKKHYKLLTLGYLISKTEPYSKFLAYFGRELLSLLKLSKVRLKLHLGQMTVIANKY